MISVRNLSIGYGSPLQADLNFEVQTGEIYVILGGSGCGKSTLLKHMIGLLAPLGGSIEIDGTPSFPPPLDAAPPYGVAFQQGALFGSMTLLQNVVLPIRKWTSLDRRTAEDVARGKLRLVSLAGFENHLPNELSGGMRKRAAIARAMALDPELLFLDEPSAGLDPVTAVALDDLLLQLNQDLGVTVVLVTHELESIFRIGTRCIMLDKQAGTAIAEGDPRQLRDESTDPRVRAFFHREPI
ncbi:MAG: ATP-binding cassette domain-containing protein [Planctomycetota bacterium]